MAVNEAFVTALESLYKLKKELAALESARATAYAAAGQDIATKQGELTTAEAAAANAAK